MKFFDKLLMITLVLYSSHIFAEWRTWPNLDTMKQEEREIFLLNNSRGELGLTFFQPKDGCKVFGCHYDGQDGDHVTLRLFNSTVDFIVGIYDARYNYQPSTVYLELMDEQGFLIASIFIGKIAPDFEGDLLGNFSMKKSVFKKIKFYRLAYYF